MLGRDTVLFVLTVLYSDAWCHSIHVSHAWVSRYPVAYDGRFRWLGSMTSSAYGPRRHQHRTGGRTRHCVSGGENPQYEDDFENEMDPARRNELRMDVVRSLQASFYQPTSFFSGDDEPVDGTFPTWDNGVLTHLPVWYVGWTEVPGRTNVLSINQPVYTNMFESILRRHEYRPKSPDEDPSCYFGHVYRDAKGKRAQNDGDDTVELGTLMRITDYQRMQGGTLLLLVQAMDRFVVTQRVQERPYGIAHVQMVLDREELTAVQPRQQSSLDSCRMLRAAACRASWLDWYPFEFRKTTFPWSGTGSTYLAFVDIPGSALNAVLPLAEYDLDREPTTSADSTVQMTRLDGKADEASLNDDVSVGNETSLEACLQEQGILKEIILPDSVKNTTLDELEIKLWLLLNDVYASTKITPPPVLLGLIPQDQTWPDNFVLHEMANRRGDPSTTDNPEDTSSSVPLSPLYPVLRRQKRLSYSGAHVLERVASASADSEQINTLRQQLVQLPSTRLRLGFVIGKLETEFGSYQ